MYTLRRRKTVFEKMGQEETSCSDKNVLDLVRHDANILYTYIPVYLCKEAATAPLISMYFNVCKLYFNRKKRNKS